MLSLLQCGHGRLHRTEPSNNRRTHSKHAYLCFFTLGLLSSFSSMGRALPCETFFFVFRLQQLPSMSRAMNPRGPEAQNSYKFSLHFSLLKSGTHILQLISVWRRHSPCAAREKFSAFCRTCVAHLKVHGFARNALHGENAIWPMPDLVL